MTHKNPIGAFLSGALVATLIGGYVFFGSKNAKRNRERAEDWMEDAKLEVAAKARRVRRLSRDKYNEIVDTVADKYAVAKGTTKRKVAEFRKTLKDRWEDFEEDAEDFDEE